MKDYYSVLGVPKSSSLDDIKKAYRNLAKTHHPDKATGDEGKFKEIAEAFEVLGNASKREQYDNPSAIGNGFSGFSFDFDSIAKEYRNRQNMVYKRVLITFEESYDGCDKEITWIKKSDCKVCDGKGYTTFIACTKCNGSGTVFVNQSPFKLSLPCVDCTASGKIPHDACKSCKGSGKINGSEEKIEVAIPQGVGTGSKIKCNDDLGVFIEVKPHPFYERIHDDIVSYLPLSYTQLFFGCKMEIELIGQKVNVKIPPKSEPGSQIRLRNLGFYNPFTGVKGDFRFVIKLDIPDIVDDEYNEALNKIKNLEDLNPGSLKRKRFQNTSQS